MNEEVISDNAFKLAKHTKGVHVDLFAEEMLIRQLTNYQDCFPVNKSKL